jgi:two-component system, NtrC family, sensor kinase
MLRGSLRDEELCRQYVGSIEVDTQPGEFSEFRVILPRAITASRAGANT